MRGERELAVVRHVPETERAGAANGALALDSQRLSRVDAIHRRWRAPVVRNVGIRAAAEIGVAKQIRGGLDNACSRERVPARPPISMTHGRQREAATREQNVAPRFIDHAGARLPRSDTSRRRHKFEVRRTPQLRRTFYFELRTYGFT